MSGSIITSQLLGQQKPTAMVDTLLFTVAAQNSVEFSIFIVNQSKDYDGYMIALVPNGTILSPANYLAFNTQLAGGATVAFSALYLNSGDSVYVTSTFGNISFTATGLDFAP